MVDTASITWQVADFSSAADPPVNPLHHECNVDPGVIHGPFCARQFHAVVGCKNYYRILLKTVLPQGTGYDSDRLVDAPDRSLEH